MTNKEWEKIRTEYATSDLSFRALSEKYGVSHVAISKRAKAENWRDDRAKGMKKTVEAVNRSIDRIAEDKAVSVAEELTGALGITAKALAKAEILLNSDDISGRDLKGITGAIKDCVELMRDFYGIPTQAQAEAQRIAAERLELERKRLELGIAPAEGSSVEITFVDLDDAES